MSTGVLELIHYFREQNKKKKQTNKQATIGSDHHCYHHKTNDNLSVLQSRYYA